MVRCPYGAINNLLSKVGDDKNLGEILAYIKSLETDIGELQGKVKEAKKILDKD